MPASSTPTATGFVHHPACLEHDTGPGHPERADRLRALSAHLEASGLAAELDLHQAEEAPLEAPELVHAQSYVERVVATCAAAPAWIDGDTPVSDGSLRAARLAVGGALAAVDRVADGAWRNAFVGTRPPGHHAEPGRGMGFCLFNNVAIAARHLQRAGVRRIAILDWDVHHGNGTQEAFWNDPDVFFASLHQSPHYPGTGAADERGDGDGEGATLNVPMAAGTGDREWLAALEERALPAIEAFRPDFLLVSAGFDAHERDPLSATRVTTEGYRRMARAAADAARRACGGRLVLLLEGGYDLEALSESAGACLEELKAGDGA